MPNPPSPKTPRRRGAWGSAVRINERCVRIRLKNPLGALLVNTIVYHTSDTLIVIDPGWPWTLDALVEALKAFDLIKGSLDEVDRYLYTHTHIDHMGAAALLSWREGAHATHHFLRDILPHTADWHGFQDHLSDWDDWMLSLLVEPHRARLAKELAARTRRKTMTRAYGKLAIKPEVIRTFALGDTLRLSEELSFAVHDASGHDPYHVAFYDERDRVLTSGDALLSIPTPITGVMGDRLDLYEATLKRLPELAIEAILPGHGTQVIGEEKVRAHIARSRGHVERYADAVREALESHHEPRDLWSLGEELKPDDTIMAHSLRWWAHLGLIQARLDLMVAQGEAERIAHASGDGPRYSLV